MRKVGTLMLVIAICWAAVAFSSMQEGTPDKDIGLSKTSVFDAPIPPAVNENASDPGDNDLLPRSNPVGPALVPHAVVDFLPITRADNLCFECHMAGEPAKEAGAVPLPESHYVDSRNSPGETKESPSGARYVCVSCHVAQTDAAALVGNRYGK